MAFARRSAPERVGRFSFALLPLALALLLLLGTRQWALAAFCLLYGVSNGIMTIVRGTVPLSLFGHAHYGAIAGALAGPNLFCQAVAPLAIAFFLNDGLSAEALLASLLALSLLSMVLYRAATLSAGRRR
jgi:hypothetical protein